MLDLPTRRPTPRAAAASLMDAIVRDVDRLLDPAPPRGAAGMPPALDVWRDGDRFVAETAVPGVRMDDLEVLATADLLTIRGERPDATPEDARVLRRERPAGRFERTIRLPEPVDPDAIEAVLEHGVLRVTLPLAEEARPRRVPVRCLPAGTDRAALPEGRAAAAGDTASDD